MSRALVNNEVRLMCLIYLEEYNKLQVGVSLFSIMSDGVALVEMKKKQLNRSKWHSHRLIVINSTVLRKSEWVKGG